MQFASYESLNVEIQARLAQYSYDLNLSSAPPALSHQAHDS
jgi:hypothetical protein